MAPKALILALAGICVVGGIIGIIVMTSSGEASSEDTGMTDAAGSMTKESRFGMTRLIKMAKEHKLIAAGIATLIVAAGAGTIYWFRKTTSSPAFTATATEISGSSEAPSKEADEKITPGIQPTGGLDDGW